MNYPPRLSHLVTKRVLVAKLCPTYAEAHHLDDEEAASRLDTALKGNLLDDLLEGIWMAIQAGAKKADEEKLLEKVARSLKDRPQRPGRLADVTPGFSAFMVVADLEAGIASDAVRRALDTEDGKRRVKAGLQEVARFLASELTR